MPSPDPTTEPDLQVIIASGPAQVQHAILGLSAALAAAEMGNRVVVVLSMMGAHWAHDEQGIDRPVPGFGSIRELIDQLQESGALLEACSACVENYCPSPVGSDGKRQLPEPFRRIGLGLIASRMTTVPTVTF